MVEDCLNDVEYWSNVNMLLIEVEDSLKHNLIYKLGVLRENRQQIMIFKLTKFRQK